MASFLITDRYTLDDYKVSASTRNGGGINPDIPMEELEKKISGLDSYFDLGYLDGLRFPANSVIHVDLPKFLQGTESMVLERYDPTSTNNTTLKMFGASKVPPGTSIKIWYSQIGLDPETVIVLGAIDHETVKLGSQLLNEVQFGAVISFPINIEPLFDSEDLSEFVRKFSAAGSHNIIEFS